MSGEIEAPPRREPTIRIRRDASGNVEAIETYQGPAGADFGAAIAAKESAK